jgi:hypothetical protein
MLETKFPAGEEIDRQVDARLERKVAAEIGFSARQRRYEFRPAF